MRNLPYRDPGKGSHHRFRTAPRQAGKKIWIRFVLVPDLTSAEENVENVAKICETFGDAVEHIDVLPFRQLGRPKWHELRIRTR